MEEKDTKSITDKFSRTIENGAVFNNPHTFFVFKKAEKIATALYVVTDFLPQQEPIKWSIRSAANELVKNVVAITKRSSEEKERSLRELNRSLLSAGSFLEIAQNTGLVSEMNFRIVNGEIRNLSNQIEDAIKGQENIDDKRISEGLFKGNVFYKGHQGQEDKRQDVFYKTEKTNVLFEKDNKSDDLKSSEKVFDKKDTTNFIKKERTERVSFSSKNRVEKIISILEKKEDVMIKDISDQIDGVSEKTIQRDLNKLIEKGLVSKEGERRWSRYSLVKQA